MTHQRIHFGQKGEDAAASFLKDRGYKIIERNARSRFGEIDIVAYDGETVCFIEVKTRASDKKGLPAESVTYFKQKKMVRLALDYLKRNHLEEKGLRSDVVSVLVEENSPIKVELIQGAFEVNG